jgi:hypothetical protein
VVGLLTLAYRQAYTILNWQFFHSSRNVYTSLTRSVMALFVGKGIPREGGGNGWAGEVVI